MRRRLIVAAVALALQFGSTVYGYLPLATFQFRNLSGFVPPGLYVGNEYFAWQVVRWRAGPFTGRTLEFNYLGIHFAKHPGWIWFVRVSVLWTIVPNIVWMAIDGRRYRIAMRARRAADPTFGRGFAIEEAKPIECCPTCGQRLPAVSGRGDSERS